ncbi:MAG: very short patch repair endonuclease [Myxococcota bacterium]
MKHQRRRDTRPELRVRRALTKLGHRYRVRNDDLAGSPDVANRRRRWAVFVHGCYWHQHPGCRRATVPARNREFWLEKFRRNRERDAKKIDELERQGYHVVVVWECQTEDDVGLADLLECAMPTPS